MAFQDFPGSVRTLLTTLVIFCWVPFI